MEKRSLDSVFAERPFDIGGKGLGPSLLGRGRLKGDWGRAVEKAGTGVLI